jgi:predicted small metal-binding protein
MKRISCGDLIPGCAFKAQAATETEVLHVESDHAREAHGIEITPRFLERARARIVDADSSPKVAPRSEAAHPG